MRKFLIAGALALTVGSLGGCAGTLQKIEAGFTVATGDIVTPRQVYITRNAFNAIEGTATAYLRRPVCATPVLCRDSAISANVAGWIRAGRDDRRLLSVAMRANPKQNISLVDVYNDLASTTAKLSAAVTGK